MSRDSKHILFMGNLSRAHLVLLCVNQYICSAKDMVAAQMKKITDNVTLTTPSRG